MTDGPCGELADENTSRFPAFKIFIEFYDVTNSVFLKGTPFAEQNTISSRPRILFQLEPTRTVSVELSS